MESVLVSPLPAADALLVPNVSVAEVRQLRPCRWHDVDTGTLERVANRSPDSLGTVDPCDPGTDPRNGTFAGVPYSDTFLPCLAR